MGKVHQLHSIILHSHDIGEADRFCIVLSKERGRVAARAHGVRKPKSRMGGSILPLQEVHLTVRESSSGWHISDCKLVHEHTAALPFDTYMHAVQCSEILLSLLEDDTPVPEIFSLMQQLVHSCRTGTSSSSLPFTIQLLCELGLLPTQSDHAIYSHIEPKEKELLQRILSDDWTAAICTHTDTKRLEFLCAKILEEQSRRPLKAANIALTM